MRLINSFDFKQRVLAEVNRRYPKDRDTAFANAVRCGIRIALRCMEQTPAVEAEPVKHGEWEDFSSIWECDQCHKWFSLEQGTADMNYCPNCGAKMDGGAD